MSIGAQEVEEKESPDRRNIVDKAHSKALRIQKQQRKEGINWDNL
jgi:hypothetical protein